MINCFQVSSQSWSSPIQEPFVAFLLSLWNDLGRRWEKTPGQCKELAGDKRRRDGWVSAKGCGRR